MRVPILAGTLLLTALSLTTLSVAHGAGPATTSAPADTEALLAKVIPEFNVKAEALEDVLKRIGEITRAKVVLDRNALADSGLSNAVLLTLDYKGYTGRQILENIAATLNTSKRIRQPFGVLVDKTGAALTSRRRVLGALNRQLDATLADYQVQDAPLASALEALHIHHEVDWKSLEAAGVSREARVSVSMQGKPAREVLRAILEALKPTKGKVEYTVEDGVLRIRAK